MGVTNILRISITNNDDAYSCELPVLGYIWQPPLCGNRNMPSATLTCCSKFGNFIPFGEVCVMVVNY